jgi:hypothetical protein
MAYFDGPNRIITLNAPTAGVLNLSVETDLYTPWKEWVIGRYFFDTETDVNGTTERISYIDHSLYTGQAIVYYDEGGAENIGLVDGTEYFVRADFTGTYNRNEFELYDTKANAEAGPATTGRLDLTASGGGSGETHRIAADNSKFLEAFRTIGGDPLAPGLEAGPYFFLQNQVGFGWRIISTDEDQTINYQGNLVPEDSAAEIINVTTGRSVLHLGLQPVTQRIDEVLDAAQLANYNGCVTIDTSFGIAGTAYPIGTPGTPVLSLADAITIATNLGLRKFCLRGSITLTGALTQFAIEGIGVDDIDTVLLNGQDISGTTLQNVTASGALPALTSPIEFVRCQIGSITDFEGTMKHCGLSDTITLAAGQTNVVECYSITPGAQVVTFDFQTTNLIDLFVAGFTGTFSIADSTNAASVVSVDLTSGVMTIDADFTDGIITVRGVGTYINDSTITTITDVGLVNQHDVKIIKQMVAGNVTISLDDLTVTVYDEDDVTVLVVLDVSADGRVRTRTT